VGRVDRARGLDAVYAVVAPLMHHRTFLGLFTVAVAIAAVAVACTLNPQPLPPDSPDGGHASGDGAVTGVFGGEDGAAPPQDNPGGDAGSGSKTDDGGETGTPGGGGDAGDAGPSDAGVSDADDAG
jgi:hypothetical protein